MKRVVAVLMIVILCTLLLAGCNKGGLVGKWEEENMGGIFEFKRNGDLLIRDAEWTYRLEGTYLVLTNEDGEDGYYNYSVSGDSLTMQDENGMFTFHLTRVTE